MSSLPQVPRFGKIVGNSASMRAVFQLIERVAAYEVPVLICGETGAGKDLVAQEIHQRSHRRRNIYVPVNMGLLSRELVLSELFGHTKGAFTGADHRKQGRFQEAEGGTLFMDEIGTMDEHVQVALLRVLEQGTCRPVGGEKDYQTDTRILAASNIDLDDAAASGMFRRDLLHRLGVFRIDVPPLRNRRDDIAHLIEYFLAALSEEYDRESPTIRDDAHEALMSFDWPGNVRELHNVIIQASLVTEDGVIGLEHLPRRMTGQSPEKAVFGTITLDKTALDGATGLWLPLGQPLENIQKQYVLRTLEHCGSNKAQAARSLGISRKTLYDRLERWESV